jgi:hypothetical protein
MDSLYKKLDPLLRRCTEELLDMDLPLHCLSRWFFPASISQNTLPTGREWEPTESVCSECDSAQTQSIADTIDRSQNVSGELLVLPHLMIDDGNSGNEKLRLSLEILKRASTMFELFGSSETSIYARSLGVYPPDW